VEEGKVIFNSDGLQGIHWKLLLITSLLIIFAFIFSGCDQFGLEQPGALSQGKEPLAADLSGGGVWIEFPPEGSELPKEPVTIVVYATGSTSGINLSANGQTIPSGPIEQLIEGGSLVRMDALWMPPEDGEYTINATSGGGSASISVCIGACQPEPDTPEPTGTKTITPTASTTPGTETPTVTVSPTTDTSQDLYIEFYVDPAYIDAGNCADVIWYVEGGNGTYLDGTYVSNSGTQTVCPCETTTYNLSVEKPDQEFEERWATLEVSGYCDVETEEPEPPVDTEGPSISSPSLVWEGCDIYLQANVSDPSGVAWATYYYNLNGGGWNSITMSNVGGDTWISDAGVPVSDGIETPLGTIQYYVEAGDNLGNISQSSSGSYDYTGCG
jgi:hypothetical protein